MFRTVSSMVAAVMLVAGSAAAQSRPAPGVTAAQQAALDQAMHFRESRYQIGQIERLLEGAVEHGATVIRDRLQAMMPADMLLAENARARGFRLDGYGVFFDVEVPNLEGTVLGVYQTLNQNDLAVDDALRTLRSYVQTSAANDVALRQALERIELQVTPGVRAANTSTAANIRTADNVSPAVAQPRVQVPDDPILANPNEAYRAAIRKALVDAMLDQARGLNIGPNELLTVAARSLDDRPRLAPADTEGQTNLLSIRGSDLAALFAGQITREEAIQRVEVRIF